MSVGSLYVYIFPMTFSPTAVLAALPSELGLPHPELVGSRGRALHYGRTIPYHQDSDYDYAYFTDDKQQQDIIRRQLDKLIQDKKWIRHDRSGGFLTASSPDGNMDLSVYPTDKRKQILKAWELIESGMNKEDAWALVNS